MENGIVTKEAPKHALTLESLLKGKTELVPAAASAEKVSLAEVAPQVARLHEERERQEARLAVHTDDGWPKPDETRLAESRRNRQQVFTTD